MKMKVDDERVCKKCNKSFPLTEEFFTKNPRCRYGLGWSCKKCRNLQILKWQNKNPERMKKTSRDSQLKRDYGISLKDYNEMFNKYKGRCAICGIHRDKLKKNFFVDHDHKTGEVRGLLCYQCNVGIGLLKENPFILLKSIKYLRGE